MDHFNKLGAATLISRRWLNTRGKAAGCQGRVDRVKEMLFLGVLVPNTQKWQVFQLLLVHKLSSGVS